MREDTKIFCIGLNKTGTSSLHAAFGLLEIKSVHFIDDKGRNIKDIIENNYKNGNKLLLEIEDYNAYSDWNHPTTNHLFKELDRQYPGSKFILNTRNLENWLDSREKHVKRLPNLKQLQNENPKSAWYFVDKTIWKNEYEKHHKDVFEYFKNRESDLLIFDITKGDGWKKLCGFLNKDIPKRAFPKSNTASSFSIMQSIKRKIISILKMPFKNIKTTPTN